MPFCIIYVYEHIRPADRQNFNSFPCPSHSYFIVFLFIFLLSSLFISICVNSRVCFSSLPSFPQFHVSHGVATRRELFLCGPTVPCANEQDKRKWEFPHPLSKTIYTQTLYMHTQSWNSMCVRQSTRKPVCSCSKGVSYICHIYNRTKRMRGKKRKMVNLAMTQRRRRHIIA